MSASVSMTVGMVLDIDECRRRIKHAALHSPGRYAEGANGELKPYTCIGVLGERGVGKSSFINALLSGLGGTTVHYLRALPGVEANSSSTECTLIPAHRLLWPELSDADIPSYLYLWDTKGQVFPENTKKDSKVMDKFVEDICGPMVNGTLTAGAQEVVMTGSHGGPRVQVLLYCITSDKDADQMNRFKAVSRWGESKKIPVYLVLTKVDKSILISDRQTYCDEFSSIPVLPNVSLTVSTFAAAAQCGVPPQRIIMCVGVDQMRLMGGTDGIRGALVLNGLLRAMGEMRLQHRLKGTSNHSSGGGVALRDADVAQLPEQLKNALLNRGANDADAAKVAALALNAKLDGAALMELKYDEVLAVFNGCDADVVERIMRIVIPYAVDGTAVSGVEARRDAHRAHESPDVLVSRIAEVGTRGPAPPS